MRFLLGYTENGTEHVYALETRPYHDEWLEKCRRQYCYDLDESFAKAALKGIEQFISLLYQTSDIMAASESANLTFQFLCSASGLTQAVGKGEDLPF